jgi:hypothetical protein
MTGKLYSAISFIASLAYFFYGFWPVKWYEVPLFFFFAFCISGLIYGLLNAKVSDLFQSPSRDDKS